MKPSELTQRIELFLQELGIEPDLVTVRQILDVIFLATCKKQKSE